MIVMIIVTTTITIIDEVILEEVILDKMTGPSNMIVVKYLSDIHQRLHQPRIGLVIQATILIYLEIMVEVVEAVEAVEVVETGVIFF